MRTNDEGREAIPVTIAAVAAAMGAIVYGPTLKALR
jgi:hypothetical protein